VMKASPCRGLLLLVALMGLVLTGCGRNPPDGAGGPNEPPEASEQQLPERTVPVFCYHKISATPSSFYEVSTEDFKEQLQLLHDEGYESVTASQIADYLEGKADLPEKAVALTFDDGPKSILTESKPLMAEHGFVGTINPTKVSAEKLAEELADSRATLEEHTASAVGSLAYPYGNYDDDVMREVRETGYRVAFTIDRGPADQTDDPMRVPRQMVVKGNSMKTFTRWVHQEKLHFADLDPPIGEHLDTSTPTFTARLADEYVPVSEVELVAGDKGVKYQVGDDGRTITFTPELAKGANIIKANYWGSPQREVSWVVVCDAE